MGSLTTLLPKSSLACPFQSNQVLITYPVPPLFPPMPRAVFVPSLLVGALEAGVMYLAVDSRKRPLLGALAPLPLVLAVAREWGRGAGLGMSNRRRN